MDKQGIVHTLGEKAENQRRSPVFFALLLIILAEREKDRESLTDMVNALEE